MNRDTPSHESSLPAYPRQYETKARFAGHLEVFFRPIKPSDAVLIKELFRSHSAETILHRYLTPMRVLPPEMLGQFVNLDYQNDMAIVGFVPCEGRERLVCVGRYFRNPAASDAEIAITVHDDCQRRGLGAFLFQLLTRIAREHGLTGFTAEVMSDNHGMLRLIQNGADKYETSLAAGVYHVCWRHRRVA